MKILRPREHKKLAQSHTAVDGRSRVGVGVMQVCGTKVHFVIPILALLSLQILGHLPQIMVIVLYVSHPPILSLSLSHPLHLLT